MVYLITDDMFQQSDWTHTILNLQRMFSIKREVTFYLIAKSVYFITNRGVSYLINCNGRFAIKEGDSYFTFKI